MHIQGSPGLGVCAYGRRISAQDTSARKGLGTKPCLEVLSTAQMVVSKVELSANEANKFRSSGPFKA